MSRLFIFCTTLVTFLLPDISEAKLIQIIHTNDLHSYFTGYNDASRSGGYARLRTKIKELKAAAAAKGIEVLHLDAGDWGDGTSWYLSHNGADSVRALGLLGTEVAVVGNHDYLLGGNTLGKQIRAADVKTKFTVANFLSTPEMELGNTVTPYVDVEKAGIPIRIIGLTTSEYYFQHSVSPGKILPANPIGEAQGLLAKKAGRELVIALTHLGTYQDSLLAKNSTSIDVIVGGHTHSKLTEVKWAKNKNKKSIPIVQAWAHGLAVGTLTLDVKEGGGASVVEYKLHEVGADVTPDPEMLSFIEKSAPGRDKNLLFPADEVLGETQTPLAGYRNGRPVIRSSCWGRHLATAARRAVGAAVGINVANFEGVAKPAGPVTYGDLADQFPHIRKYGDQGWEIATVYMSGLKLRALMYYISRRGYGVTFSGLGYLSPSDLEEKGTYRIAFPAEVAYAIQTSIPGYRHYLQGLKYTGKYYWPVMADYIRENTPLTCR